MRRISNAENSQLITNINHSYIDLIYFVNIKTVHCHSFISGVLIRMLKRFAAGQKITSTKFLDDNYLLRAYFTLG